MTVIATVPQTTYTPRTFTASPTIGVGIKQAKATLTRVSWPVGAVATVEIIFPDGRSAGTVGFDGGPGLARDGSATSVIGIQGNDGANLPAGVYTVRVIVLQTITTAVTIETF